MPLESGADRGTPQDPREEPLQPAAGSAPSWRGIQVVLLAGVLLCALRISLIGITDPSEGRYAEIARAMVESGDWLVPRWYGVVHLEKPPLVYWCGAAGIRVLGANEVAIRVIPSLLFLATALLAAAIARGLGGTTGAAAAAGICLAPYPVAVGEALLTDGLNLFAATLFFYGLLRFVQGGHRRALHLTTLALVVGFLAKGPTILLFTLGPVLIARPRLLREILHPWRILAFLLLTAPWFVLIQIRFPEFFDVHVLKLFHFAATGEEHHHAPFWIYVAVLVAGIFPHALHLRRGSAGLGSTTSRLLWAWLLLPLLVFTVVPSRTWTYILPAATPVAVLGGRGLLASARRVRLATAVAFLGAGGVLWLVLGWIPVYKGVDATVLEVFAIGMIACGAWGFASHRTSGQWFPLGFTTILTLTLVAAAYRGEATFQIHRRLAREAMAIAGDRPVVVVGMNAPSIAFYARRPVVATKAGGRLPHEADYWGESALFQPDLRVAEALRSGALVILPESLRAKVSPEVQPCLTVGQVSVICKP